MSPPSKAPADRTSVGKTAAAIIAGGRGLRMGGVTKGLLAVAGRRIIDRQLELLRARFDHVVIIANDPSVWAGLDVPIVGDLFGGGSAGPLAGLHAALIALPPEVTGVVCVASDMPFLSDEALSLIDVAPAPEACDAVVPRTAAAPEPLFAWYHRRCATQATTQLQQGVRALHRFLETLRVRWVDEERLRATDPTLSFLANVNSPADLERF